MSYLELDRLSRLVDLEATAAWRRVKTEQYPEDPRNRAAAELCERLAPQIAALNGSPLHLRLETFIHVEVLSLEISQILKAIGFRYFPQSGAQLLADIVADLERRQEAGSPFLRLVEK